MQKKKVLGIIERTKRDKKEYKEALDKYSNASFKEIKEMIEQVGDNEANETNETNERLIMKQFNLILLLTPIEYLNKALGKIMNRIDEIYGDAAENEYFKHIVKKQVNGFYNVIEFNDKANLYKDHTGRYEHFSTFGPTIMDY